MRGLGIIGLFIALWMIAYGWFALGWDGGTERVAGDWIVIGVGAVLGLGAVALIARRSWGWAVAGAGGVAALVLFLMAPLRVALRQLRRRRASRSAGSRPRPGACGSRGSPRGNPG